MTNEQLYDWAFEFETTKVIPELDWTSQADFTLYEKIRQMFIADEPAD